MAVQVGLIEAILRLRDELSPALGRARLQLQTTADHIQRTSMALAPVSAALGAAGGAAFAFGKDFEAVMRRVETLSGVSADMVDRMRARVLELARHGRSPEELGRALLVVTSTGLRGAEALEILEAAAKASAVGLGDMKDIARAVTAAMTAYGVENLSAARAANVLFAAVREGGAEAAEFAGTLGRVVGIAAQVGVSFDEVAAFVAAFTRLGVDASEAVTALRGALGTLLDPSQEARRALDLFGLSIDDLRRSVRERGFGETMIALIETMQGNADAVGAVFDNVRALAGVLGTAGVQAEKYREVMAAVRGATDDLETAFARTTTTVEFGWAQLLAQLRKTATQWFDALRPGFELVGAALLKLATLLGGAAEAFGQLPGPVRAAATAFGVLIVAAPAVGLALANLLRLIDLLALSSLPRLGLAAVTAGTQFAGPLVAGIRAAVTALGGLPGIAAGALAGLAIAVIAREFDRGVRQMEAGLARLKATADDARAVQIRDIIDPKLRTQAEQARAAVASVEEASRRAVSLGMDPLAEATTGARIQFTQLSLTARDAATKVGTLSLETARAAAAAKAATPTWTATIALGQQLATEADHQAAAFARLEAALSRGATTAARFTPAQERLIARALEAGFAVSQLAKDLGVSEVAIEAVKDRQDELARAAKEAADAQRRLREAVLGTDVQRDVVALERLWRELSGAKELNAFAAERLITQYEALRDELSTLSPQLEAARAAIRRLDLDIDAHREALARVRPEIQLLGRAWDEHLRRLSPTAGIGFGDQFAKQSELAARSATATREAMLQLITTQPILAQHVSDAAQAVRDQADAFREAVGPTVTWGEIVRATLDEIPRLVTAALTGGGGLGGALKAMISTLFGGVGARLFDVQSALGGAIARAAGIFGTTFQAAFAEILPGIGHALGAIVGPLIGKIASLFRRPEWQKVIADAGRDLGVTLSESLAKQIAEDSKRLGDRVAATLLNLPKIIAEAGGVETFGLDRALAKTRDLFVMIETGKLSVHEAGRTLSALFGEILPAAIDKTTGLAKTQFVELVTLAERFGLKVPELQRFVADQTTAVIGGLGTFLEHATVSSQEAATAMATAAVAAFDRLRQQGAPVGEALRQLDPILVKLSEQFTKAGFVGGEAFARLQQLAAVARDEIAGPALTAVDGLRQVLVGLANTGLLNQEVFAGLARQTADTFAHLVAQGKDGATVLALMQPTLQTLWELQRRFGFQVDETTAALLKQAEEAGLVGATHQDAMTRAAEALERVAATLERLVGATGHFRDELTRIPRDIKVNVHWEVPPLPTPEGIAIAALQHGGIVTRPTVALLGERGPEAVVPLSGSRGGPDLRELLRALEGVRDEQTATRAELRWLAASLPRAMRDAVLGR